MDQDSGDDSEEDDGDEDSTGTDGGTLLIYNPVGKLTTLSLNKFMHTFSDISVSSKRPLLGPCQFDKIDVTCAG